MGEWSKFVNDIKKAYSEPSQISKMEFSCEKIFSILDVSCGSEYASAYNLAG